MARLLLSNQPPENPFPMMPETVELGSVYLAASYGRRAEVAAYGQDLVLRFMVPITSRWLDGSHDVEPGAITEPLGDTARAATFAQEDLHDVYLAQTLIIFTEPPDGPKRGRGGRFVEMGIAIAIGRTIIIIGPRENIFTYLPRVIHFDTWDDFTAKLLNT